MTLGREQLNRGSRHVPRINIPPGPMPPVCSETVTPQAATYRLSHFASPDQEKKEQSAVSHYI